MTDLENFQVGHIIMRKHFLTLNPSEFTVDSREGTKMVKFQKYAEVLSEKSF